MSPPAAALGAALVPMDATHLGVVLGLEAALFGAQAWSAQTLREELADPSRHYVVAVATGVVAVDTGVAAGSDGPDPAAIVGSAASAESADSAGVVGYAGLAGYDDEAHVMTVGVLPAWRRRGVASAMLRDLLAAAGPRRVILEVGADNAAARELYTRHGFAVIGTRRHYYGHGAHAAVMAREAEPRRG